MPLTVEQSIEVEKCRRDAHYFIFDSGYLRTKDEHDPTVTSKRFPGYDSQRIFLDALLVSGHMLRPEDALWSKRLGIDPEFLEQLYYSGLFFCEKSRQLMATWLICAYLLWRVRAKPNQLILVQSKKEEDAANLVFIKDPINARISFMEHNLPDWLKVVNFKRDAAYAQLFFPQTGGKIWGIPEGGHIVRSNTASVLFSDEAGFQAEFGEAYTAAIPSVKGGGQLVAISSAEPGVFQELVESP